MACVSASRRLKGLMLRCFGGRGLDLDVGRLSPSMRLSVMFCRDGESRRRSWAARCLSFCAKSFSYDCDSDRLRPRIVGLFEARLRRVLRLDSPNPFAASDDVELYDRFRCEGLDLWPEDFTS